MHQVQSPSRGSILKPKESGQDTKLWCRSKARPGGRARDRAGDPCSCGIAGAGTDSSGMSQSGVLGHGQCGRGPRRGWEGMMKPVNDPRALTLIWTDPEFLFQGQRVSLELYPQFSMWGSPSFAGICM